MNTRRTLLLSALVLAMSLLPGQSKGRSASTPNPERGYSQRSESMKTRQWYRARIRWAEMVEGRGIRHWEEGLYPG